MKMIAEMYGYKFELSIYDAIENRIQNGLYEWPEISIMKPFVFPGKTALDVGANNGVYSLVLSGDTSPANQGEYSKGKVYAFEPHPENFKRLVKNINLNNKKNNIICHQIGLGDIKDTGYYRDADLSSNSGGYGLNKSDSNGLKIETTTIDEFVTEFSISNIGFIKIDVEGWEDKVLKGGNNSIKRYKPNMLIEFIGTRDSISNLLSILSDYKYDIFKIHKKPIPHLKKLQSSDLEGTFHFNTICVHKKIGLNVL